MNRIFYLDLLKGVSIFFVVLLHTAALGLSMSDIGSVVWEVCNVTDSLCRFVVPVFVMISGTLLLNNNRQYHLFKSVKRLIIPLLLWSMLYSFMAVTYQYRMISFESVTAFLRLTFLTPTHNWFLYMLIGIYLTVPLLRPIITNGGGRLIIILWIVFGVCLPFIDNFEMFDSINTFAKRFSITLPLGYIGYFVLGYELSNTNCFMGRKFIGLLSATSFAIIVSTAALTHFVSASQGCLTELFYNYMSPAIAVYSVCIFLLAKNLYSDNHSVSNYWYSKPVVLMSKYSLAIYMFHEFILIFVQKIGVNPTVAHPMISLPTIALGIYVSSFVVIHVCAKNSIFRKYMM